uniref:SCHIP-1 domain-containing protein n=1 Tax=Syphacia muris TaxID=451379 RepID=A0A0N5AL15_9BILA
MLVNRADSHNQTNFNIQNNNINFCEKVILNSIAQSAEPCNPLDQRSNTSSLESLESPPLDDNRAVSTSCSSDSFEMSSTTSHVAGDLSALSDSSSFLRPATPQQHADSLGTSGTENLSRPNSHSVPVGFHEANDVGDQGNNGDNGVCRATSELKECYSCNAITNGIEQKSWCEKPTTSKSFGSLTGDCVQKTGLDALRESIEKELNDLDTCLPKLDFNKLEEKLNCAAKERLITERKLLGEQVRRRLALQVDELTAGPSPRISTRPSKSNLGLRLQTAMNLQVCYINGMENSELDVSSSTSDDDFDMPKSKSVPNLRGCVPDGSSLNASELRQRTAVSELEDKRNIFAEETKMMLAKAKQTARLQMELERLNSLSLEGRYTSNSEHNNKLRILNLLRFRLQLSRTELTELRKIAKRLSDRIATANVELVKLLVERDSLHMQQDSMLVDIEDMIQHQSKSESLNLPEFLKVEGTTPKKFRLFKG